MMKLALTATTTEVSFGPILFRTSFDQAFAAAAELGYDGVELHLRRADTVEAKEIRRLMDRYHLEVPTIGTGQAAGMDHLTFTDPDAVVRGRAAERIRAQIMLASELGAAVIIGLILGQLGQTEEERRIRKEHGVMVLDECCRAAEQENVALFLEPINRYENDHLHTLADAIRMVEEIGRPNLKILADTFHMNIEEADLPSSIRSAGRHLGHVHLADSNREAAGHGHLDVPGILAALADISYQGYLAFEILPRPDPHTAAREAIEFIRPLLDDLT